MTGERISSTHPPLPPTTEEDRFLRLRLLRSRRVGVSTYHRLMAEHGTAQNALAALPEVAKQAGLDAYEICPAGVIDAEITAAKAASARLLCLGDPEYPPVLATLSDAPPLLWAQGDLALLARDAVAVVGARNASSLGLRMARKVSRELGDAGYVVVSGLARGIDTAAHMAALEGGTIAVMAGGVDVVYPSENAHLARDIALQGVRLSEQPMGLQPQARHFPRRNRIISGVSLGVVVIEAAGKSGSLITARDALDQGREVMAVPGHPFDARAAGCNRLIRDGAALIRGIEDIQMALSPSTSAHPQNAPSAEAKPTSATRTPEEIAQLHHQILNRLGPSPLAEDQLIRDLGAPAHSVSPILTTLELDGKIARKPGGLLARVS